MLSLKVLNLTLDGHRQFFVRRLLSLVFLSFSTSCNIVIVVKERVNSCLLFSWRILEGVGIQSIFCHVEEVVLGILLGLRNSFLFIFLLLLL